MAKILGLDLGTNSIGWAVVNKEELEDGSSRLTGISSCGSRIIPMDGEVLGKFSSGVSVSQTKIRTEARGARRLIQRRLLRRERLHRVLLQMDFLPKHYAENLTRYGHFRDDVECKLAWKREDDGKYHFLFQDSYAEMLEDFAKNQPKLVENGKRIPYDWTLYYLRKKALIAPIQKEELAWILLNANAKRGYYQLRSEEEEKNTDNKKIEYLSQKVVRVEESGPAKGGEIWYDVHLENGMVYHRKSKYPLDWVGKTREFIVTTDLDVDGNPKTDKEGQIKRSFRSPKEDDWELVKTRTEKDINDSKLTVGAYIYDVLLNKSEQKIRGKLVSTVERKYYKEELTAILQSQSRFHPEFQDKDLYNSCIMELYSVNEAHRNNLQKSNLASLILNDILFYQRPLKSKKSLISNCPYESRVYIDKETKAKCISPLKCISKSHPLFQEFRLWQFISNLRIYKRQDYVDGKLIANRDITSSLLPNNNAYGELFKWLYNYENINQKKLLKYFKDINGTELNETDYRWNYVEDKAYPCNETHGKILSYLKRAKISPLTPELEMSLWQILYSIDGREELKKALRTFAHKNHLDDNFDEAFSKFPAFKKEYGSYSYNAINKMLPLMRAGAYWSEEAIDPTVRTRIEKILSGEYDETITDRVREKSINLHKVSDFQNLPIWLVCYIVYGRHSEAEQVTRWQSPSDIDKYLSSFKQYSLRNPIVEQVVMESLRTVRDIWKQEGRIDEVHIELGRELKKNAEQRKKDTQRITDNENTNLRIKSLLAEFSKEEYGISDVRPYSQSQQEKLRIYEEYALMSLNNNTNINEQKNDTLTPDEVKDILNKFNEKDISRRPSHKDFERYKLWLEQKYKSPYTDKIIPLSKLFTEAYEIEHVIPQKLYFDDSMSNKVICEAAVNRLKGATLAYNFIANHGGEKVEIGYNETVTILRKEEYEHLVKENYSSNTKKMNNLLREDIPDDFIQRQLNDSRYISKVVRTLLSNIVREDDEIEAVSKHVIACNGAITDRLKDDWGVKAIWNKIILPRFERMNEITGTTNYTELTLNGHLIPAMPLSEQKGFNKKRIDHRHHAMDAIVIACADRNIVNYLNNASACSNSQISRYDLQHLLCDKIVSGDNYNWILKKPWPTFTQDAYHALSSIIVSFKQNLRVITETSNHYRKFNKEKGRFEMCLQEKKKDSEGKEIKNWAIRKPLHKDTVYGEVNLRMIKQVGLKDALVNPTRIVNKDLKKKIKAMLELDYSFKRIKEYFDSEDAAVWDDINLKKIDVYYYTNETDQRYYASRCSVLKLFEKATTLDKAKKCIEQVTDTGIKQIFTRHLEECGNDPVIAFSSDGIEKMNENILRLNGGVPHKPIYSVRKFEQANKYQVGSKGNKSTKYVEAAKGTNLYYAIYEFNVVDKKSGDVITKREFATIPLYELVDRLKQGLSPCPADAQGHEPKYVLSPNDLVYVPTPEEQRSGVYDIDKNRDRIYKFVSSSGKRSFFINAKVANVILDGKEYGSLNKMERSIDEYMIKEICVPVKVDRLGNILSIE